MEETFAGRNFLIYGSNIETGMYFVSLYHDYDFNVNEVALAIKIT